MAIFQRFVTVVKSYLNAIIGKAEDPEKMLNQMLLDMQEQLIQAKKQVAVSIADEKRLSQQYQQEQTLSDEWEKRAMLAIKAGDDDLAKQALERKTEHDKHAQGFHQNWVAQKDAVEKLKTALIGLNEKISEAKRKKNLLVARAKRAEAQQTISETMAGISQTNAMDTINRMEEKIDRMEAEAAATSEMANELEVDQLESKFQKLNVVETDDALAVLKAKMGIKTTNVPVETETLRAIEKEIQAEVAAKK